MTKFNTIVNSPNGNWDLDKNTDSISQKVRVCKDCIFFSRCPGINQYYLDMWGEQEIKPVKKLKYFVDGEFKVSATTTYMDCYNPSTGDIIAHAPQCTQQEVDEAIATAQKAYPEWSATPVSKRVQVLYKFKALVEKHLEELTHLLCEEEGKNWTESMGDVLKVNEVVEFACGAPHLMKGESVMNASTGYDKTW